MVTDSRESNKTPVIRYHKPYSKREIAGHHLHPWKVFDECIDCLSILKTKYPTLPLTTIKRRITLFGTFAYFDKGERRFIATRSRVGTHLRKDRIDTGARNPLVYKWCWISGLPIGVENVETGHESQLVANNCQTVIYPREYFHPNYTPQ